MIRDLADVPSPTLAFLAGRLVATAQIECNAGTGREHAIQQHAEAAAIVHVLGEREEEVFALAVAVDALGTMIRQSFPDGRTLAEYPPGPRLTAAILAMSIEALTA